MSDSTTECCKTGRVAAEYGFRDRLDQELGDQWETENGPGLRPLARRFNTLVVDAALLEAGEPPLEGEAEMLYELLTGDDVVEAERARARSRLTEYGIDPEKLADDFISYRTLDRHFKNCTDRERAATPNPASPEDVLNRVNTLKNRLEQVTAKSIREVSQRTAIGIDSDEADIFVQVTVVCPDCGDRLQVHELFEEGCRCTDTDPGASTDDSPPFDDEEESETNPPADVVEGLSGNSR